jgi:hypothetical protein
MSTFNLLQPGTRIRVRGKGRSEILGRIMDFWKDERRGVIGYQVKPDDHTKGIMLVALDNYIEVVGK